ncbi:MAG TPA: 16S rRNA (adenine(1518)-N(6)/adenine(1519)-N(6))-dimethyltransferase RsmA [Afifellaceae bacterium]|nr:16S rRNA (adenine(1518)-N(6)/adenine(1519)-N(6))-dimethyltransferase RsmA [Afifellaceae bacterium]
MSKGPDSVEALPPLKQVISEFGLAAKKSLGQNFLLDLNLTRRIARAGGRLDGCHIMEIGPGPGGLTRALLLEGAGYVTAIERDRRAIPALEQIAAAAGGRLTIVEGDALKVDQAALANGAMPVRIVANLPYNVATPLLTRWVTPQAWPSWWQSLTLMFQREVGERIVARPGGKNYGRLSVLCGWRCTAKILFDVPPGAFTPPPKVTSSIVRLEPRADAARVAPEALEAITAAAFGQRRKMLRSSLKSVLPEPEAALRELGIEPDLRAEALPVADFIRIAQLYSGQS